MTMYSSDFASNGGGSSTLKIQQTTSDGIVNDWNYCVLADASSLSSNLVITLPISTANSVGKSVIIKKTDNSNNAICIKPNGTDLFNNSVNPVYLYNKNDCMTIMSSENGKCETLPDNRNSTGSTMSFCRVTNPSGLSATGLTGGSPLTFSTIETMQGTGISFNTSTSTFILQPNRTYKLTAYIPKINLSSGGYFYARWYNDTIASYVGAGSGGDAVTSPSNTMHSNIATYTVTPSVVTKLRCLIKGLNSVNSIGETDVMLSAEVEEISRQASVINTLDYLNISRTSSDFAGMTASTTSNTYSDIVFDSIVSGNISYNVSNGIVQLTAGKCYEFFGEPSFTGFTDTTNGYIAYEWVDASNNTPLISNSQGSGTAIPINRNASEFDSPIAHIIYTPPTNQTVKLRVTSNVGTATFRSKAGSKAIIRQVGSTATSSIGGQYIDAPYIPFTPTITAVTTNPTFGANTKYKCAYKQTSKKSIQLIFNLIGDGSNNMMGSGIYKIQLPITIDTSLLQLATASNWYDATTLTTTYMTNGSGNNNYWCKILPWSANELVVMTQAGYWAHNIHATPASFSFVCEIPIA